MEQFRLVGETLGSMKALMVFRESIQINQRQCKLLVDMFNFAYDSISEEMKMKLNFEERNKRWQVLENPLRNLFRVFKDGETYIRQCLESKDWLAKAIILHHNTDCVEFHIHNLLSCLPIAIEAIEIASELSGWDSVEAYRKKVLHMSKYKIEWSDPELFTLKFGKQYAVTSDFRSRIDTAWKEDQWILRNKIKVMKNSSPTKQERRLMNLLWLKLHDGPETSSQTLLSSSILIGSKDYQVRQRLGSGAQYKEITWLGEGFAMRHFFGDIETLVPEICSLLSLSHPNVMHYLCGFTDDEKRECFLVMELMNKTLHTHTRETCGPRKKSTISLPIAVDLMLQIARGMEYLHSKKVFHGELNPSNILVKPRWNNSTETYLHAKITGFGLSSINGFTSRKGLSNQNEPHSFIWHCPEVLEEQEQTGTTGRSKYTEKSDAYSFGMVCFELLTGKVPFEDSHLQGDKMSRNIRAGERPLFPFNSPKYITNLTKRCWHTDPNQRPSFSSICRILRYIKRFIILNSDANSHQEPSVPCVDYSEIETWLCQKFHWEGSDMPKVWQIPLQMFSYRVIEREKSSGSFRETSDSGSDKASISGEENGTNSDDASSNMTGSHSCASKGKTLPSIKRFADVKPLKQPLAPRTRTPRPPRMIPCSRSMRMNSESQLMLMSPRRTSPGHVSDSELS